jgi:SWIM zinc finger
MVNIDKEKGIVSCNCKGWEFEGLLCSHAIKVVHHVGMTNLSSHYILKRWTRDANASVKVPISERCMESGESAELKTLRFATIKSDLMEIADMGTTSQEVFKVLKSIIVQAKEKLQLIIFKKVGEEVLSKEQVEMVEKQRVPCLYIDPPNS